MTYYPLSAQLELCSKMCGQVPAVVGYRGSPSLGTDDVELCSARVGQSGAGELRFLLQRLRGTPGLPGVKISDFFRV